MTSIAVYYLMSQLKSDLNKPLCVNSCPPGKKMAAILADDIFKCIFLSQKFCIVTRITLTLVPNGPIDNKWALVQVMAWRQTSDKPLPGPMMT